MLCCDNFNVHPLRIAIKTVYSHVVRIWSVRGWSSRRTPPTSDTPPRTPTSALADNPLQTLSVIGMRDTLLQSLYRHWKLNLSCIYHWKWYFVLGPFVCGSMLVRQQGEEVHHCASFRESILDIRDLIFLSYYIVGDEDVFCRSSVKSIVRLPMDNIPMDNIPVDNMYCICLHVQR